MKDNGGRGGMTRDEGGGGMGGIIAYAVQKLPGHRCISNIDHIYIGIYMTIGAVFPS